MPVATLPSLLLQFCRGLYENLLLLISQRSKLVLGDLGVVWEYLMVADMVVQRREDGGATGGVRYGGGGEVVMVRW